MATARLVRITPIVAILAAFMAGCNPVTPFVPGGRDGRDDVDPNASRGTTVTFRTVPAGARITLDGTATQAVTPADITDVPSKILGTEHTFSLALSGYYTYTGLVTTYYDRANTTVDVNLVENTAAPAMLIVESTPSGAAVSLDSVNTGERTPATLDPVSPTGHVLSVAKNGYDTRTEFIALEPGEERLVQIELSAGGTDAVGGIVFDAVTGSMVVGAQVRIEGTTYETTTSIQGSYVFESIPRGVYAIEARKTLSSGEDLYGRVADVNVFGEGDRLVNTHILIGDAANLSTLSGKVTNEAAQAISGALVSALLVVNGNGIASMLAVTSVDGVYRFNDLPPGTYDVVATASGRDNAGLAELQIAAATNEVLNFELHPIPADAGEFLRPELDGEPQALTYPKPSAVTDAAYLAVRERVEERCGTARSRMQALEELRRNRRAVGVRGIPPVDSHIEIDVYWTYQGEPDLAGYNVYRSIDETQGYRRAVQVPDPNAGFAADISPLLAAGMRYYYDVDAFSTDGSYYSPTSEPGSAVPLDRMQLIQPADNDVVPAAPTLSWRRLPGAQVYGVLIYDGLPDFDTGSNPVVWESPDLAGSVTSVGLASVQDAPVLVSGRTYYWIVVARDAGSGLTPTAMSFSPLRSFIVE